MKLDFTYLYSVESGGFLCARSVPRTLRFPKIKRKRQERVLGECRSPFESSNENQRQTTRCANLYIKVVPFNDGLVNSKVYYYYVRFVKKGVTILNSRSPLF